MMKGCVIFIFFFQHCGMFLFSFSFPFFFSRENMCVELGFLSFTSGKEILTENGGKVSNVLCKGEVFLVK